MQIYSNLDEISRRERERERGMRDTTKQLAAAAHANQNSINQCPNGIATLM